MTRAEQEAYETNIVTHLAGYDIDTALKAAKLMEIVPTWELRVVGGGQYNKAPIQAKSVECALDESRRLSRELMKGVQIEDGFCCSFKVCLGGFETEWEQF